MAKDWKRKCNLLEAVLGGDSEKVRLILAESPDLRLYLDDGEHQLLHKAVMRGNAGVVRTLAAAGFDVNARDANGMTPLLHAVNENRLDCIFPLVEFGADLNATDANGWAPLHVAVRNGNHVMVNVLGWLKADPNVPNSQMGATPLHIACFLDRDDLIPQLLNLGADPMLEDVNGLTPVAIAAHEGNGDARRAVFKWLTEHEADDSGSGPDEFEPESDGEGDGPEEDCVFTTCDWCGRDIHVGNACVTVGRSIEQIDWSAELCTEEIQVIDSEPLLTLCAACGNRLDTGRLRKKLSKGPMVGTGR